MKFCWMWSAYRLNKDPDLYICLQWRCKCVPKKHVFHTIVPRRHTLTNTPADETWYFGNLTLKSPEIEEMKATSVHTSMWQQLKSPPQRFSMRGDGCGKIHESQTTIQDRTKQYCNVDRKEASEEIKQWRRRWRDWLKSAQTHFHWDEKHTSEERERDVNSHQLMHTSPSSSHMCVCVCVCVHERVYLGTEKPRDSRRLIKKKSRCQESLKSGEIRWQHLQKDHRRILSK